MLKITEIKMYKDKALKRFVVIFTGFKSPKIVVVPASKRQAVRCKVLDSGTDSLMAQQMGFCLVLSLVA